MSFKELLFEEQCYNGSKLRRHVLICSTVLLQLLPENLGDPIELLSYLGPPERGDSANQNSNVNNGTNTTNTNSDDLLALFES